jgi:hypothetical protein
MVWTETKIQNFCGPESTFSELPQTDQIAKPSSPKLTEKKKYIMENSNIAVSATDSVELAKGAISEHSESESDHRQK